MLMLILAAGKILTFALTIGSGGSGGVFAPSLFTGAMLGGFLSAGFHQPTAAFVVVGMAAVFGAAAKVPIATLLMVTEMTGGYHLLVVAALAVFLSFWVQTLLSGLVRYESLYGAQVPTRAYSPAHYGEQVRTALDLLRKRNISNIPEPGSLDLMPLLTAGLPIRLGEDKQLRIVAAKPQSSCIGRPLACLQKSKQDMEFILVLRDEIALWPAADLRLRPEDRLIGIGSKSNWAALAPDLEPLHSREEAAPRTSP